MITIGLTIPKTQKRVSVRERLEQIIGPDKVMSIEEAKEVHEYYLSMLGVDLNSADTERLVLANRRAEGKLNGEKNLLEYGINFCRYAKCKVTELYAKYIKTNDKKQASITK